MQARFPADFPAGNFHIQFLREQGNTVQKPELLRAVSRAILEDDLVESTVDQTVKEVRDPIIEYCME